MNNLNIGQLIDIYYCCIFNYLNYKLKYETIDNVYNLINNSQKTIEQLEYYNKNLKFSYRWYNEFTPLKLYKDMCKRGIFFPFLLRDNFITFGTHRLWSIYIYNNYIKSNRLVPIIVYDNKDIVIFVPNKIWKYNQYDNLNIYKFNGEVGYIKKHKTLWSNNYISLIKINGDNIMYMYLLGDFVSKKLYDLKKLFSVPEISCQIKYNLTDIVEFRNNILKKMNIKLSIDSDNNVKKTIL